MKEQQTDLVEQLENVEESDTAKKPLAETYTDDQLSDAGIVKVKAYMRSERSKNALRIQKSRDKKKKEENLKQVNCQIPAEFADELKAIAKFVRENKRMPDQPEPKAPEVVEMEKKDLETITNLRNIQAQGGLKARVLRWIGVY